MAGAAPKVKTLGEVRPDPGAADFDEERLLGQAISVEFELPDGSRVAHRFRQGHQVAALKSKLESAHGLPYDEIDLYLGRKLLADPLSLCDVPQIDAASVNVITVKRHAAAQAPAAAAAT